MTLNKIISSWEYKLFNANEDLVIHIDASLNNDYTSDMRDYARSRVLSLEKYIELLVSTIDALKTI